MSTMPSSPWDFTLAADVTIGTDIRYVRGVNRARSPIWGRGYVYRKTKNFVFIQTNSKKIKFDNDSHFFPV
jgi:RNase P/RNase MRP subunit p29